jgi:imidazole glycerol-phosphate synthase subunit HisH
MTSKIAVIDYGHGNLRSMVNALSHVVGEPVILSADPAELARAERLVLPGVGAFGACAASLRRTQLDEVVVAAVRGGTPLLGVCVGMQVMADVGHEFGEHKGMGIVSGSVQRLDAAVHTGLRRAPKLPHVGFAPLDIEPHALWQGFVAEPKMYFVHSFAFAPTHAEHVLAQCAYAAWHDPERVVTFCAAVQKNNVVGVQFHPERSGKDGIEFLHNFVQWTP